MDEKLQQQLADLELGFCQAPARSFVFIAAKEINEKMYPWYTLGANDEMIPREESALLGYLHKITLVAKPHYKRPDETVFKLRFEITANRPFVLQCGADTTIARGWLLALMSVSDISRPFYFSARVGHDKDSKVVLGDIYHWDRRRVKADWDKDKKLIPLVFELQKRLGHTPQNLDDVLKAKNSQMENGSRY